MTSGRTPSSWPTACPGMLFLASGIKWVVHRCPPNQSVPWRRFSKTPMGANISMTRKSGKYIHIVNGLIVMGRTSHYLHCDKNLKFWKVFRLETNQSLSQSKFSNSSHWNDVIFQGCVFQNDKRCGVRPWRESLLSLREMYPGWCQYTVRYPHGQRLLRPVYTGDFLCTRSRGKYKVKSGFI